MITFEYNGRTYKPSNLDKKLKSMGITINDIKIIEDKPSVNETISNLRSVKVQDNSKRYCFWDKKCKGWFDSKYEDMRDWPFNTDDFVYTGSTLEDETVEQAHTRLFKLTFTL